MFKKTRTTKDIRSSLLNSQNQALNSAPYFSEITLCKKKYV